MMRTVGLGGLSWRKISLILAGIWLLAGLLTHLAALHGNRHMQSGDQGAYLALALQQKEAVHFTDGNRHPLYPLLLAPFAERSPEFFARSRWVSFALGLLLYGLILRHEWRRSHEPLVIMALASFLCLHVQMVRTTTEVWCEPLLYLLVFFAWSRLDNLKKGCAPSLGWFLAGGLATGLIYLTKGTGLQIAALFWLTAWAVTRCHKGALIGIAVFLLVSSPLLLWNQHEYGSFFYNFASTHNMWFDEADEIWYDDPATLPTLASYLQTHTAGEIHQRVIRGILLESQMTFQLLWSDWALPEASPAWLNRLFLAWKIPLALFGLAGLIGAFRKSCALTSLAGGLFLTLLGIVFFLSFGWYAQLTHEPRFLMTLAPIAALLIARALPHAREAIPQSLMARLSGAAWLPHLRLGAGVAAFLIAGAVLLLSGVMFWRSLLLPSPAVEAAETEVLEALNELPKNSTVAFGPSHGLTLWLARGDLRWRPVPWRIDWERFNRFLSREGIQYTLLDGETLARREFLAPLANPAQPPAAEWKTIYRARSREGFFILWKREK